MTNEWTKLNMSEQDYNAMIERDRVFNQEKYQKIYDETERVQKLVDTKKGADCTNKDYFEDDESIIMRGYSIMDCIFDDYLTNHDWDEDFILNVCKESPEHQQLILDGMIEAFKFYFKNKIEFINRLK
jgi:hypothetical protein